LECKRKRPPQLDVSAVCSWSVDDTGACADSPPPPRSRRHSCPDAETLRALVVPSAPRPPSRAVRERLTRACTGQTRLQAGTLRASRAPPSQPRSSTSNVRVYDGRAGTQGGADSAVDQEADGGLAALTGGLTLELSELMEAGGTVEMSDTTPPRPLKKATSMQSPVWRLQAQVPLFDCHRSPPPSAPHS